MIPAQFLTFLDDQPDRLKLTLVLQRECFSEDRVWCRDANLHVDDVLYQRLCKQPRRQDAFEWLPLTTVTNAGLAVLCERARLQRDTPADVRTPDRDVFRALQFHIRALVPFQAIATAGSTKRRSQRAVARDGALIAHPSFAHQPFYAHVWRRPKLIDSKE